jgi:hypothetical protein
MAHNYSNTASTAQLDAPLNSSANSFQVTGFTGYPAAPFYILMDRDTSSAELMEVTQVAGSTLTVTRGAGGTASTPHAAGAAVEHVIPAAVPQAVEQHVEATTNVHGVTGALVGADDATTLTNKTYRGAGRHVYSDSLPAAPAAGFIVEADTSISRDGFVAAGTAANTDRRGFLLTQSGANRFEARYDGTVKITPSGASTHPGLEVTTGITADTLTTTHDATVGEDLSVANLISANALTVANATVSSGLSTLGTSNLAQVNASGTVTAAGSGTGLQVTNAANVGGALTVAGTGTALTLSGTNARLRFPSSPTASTPGTASGEVRHRAGMLEVWDGTVWRGQGGHQGGGVLTMNPGGLITNTTTDIGNFTIPGFGANVPYRAFVMAQCELNNTTPGARFDLFIFEGSDFSDTGSAIAVGVGPGFTQTGLGSFFVNDGGGCVFHAVVKRTVGGGGTTCELSAFNQMFTVMAIPRHS